MESAPELHAETAASKADGRRRAPASRNPARGEAPAVFAAYQKCRLLHIGHDHNALRFFEELHGNAAVPARRDLPERFRASLQAFVRSLFLAPEATGKLSKSKRSEPQRVRTPLL